MPLPSALHCSDSFFSPSHFCCFLIHHQQLKTIQFLVISAIVINDLSLRTNSPMPANHLRFLLLLLLLAVTLQSQSYRHRPTDTAAICSNLPTTKFWREKRRAAAKEAMNELNQKRKRENLTDKRAIMQVNL